MIYLCLAHMSEDGAEQKFVKEAFDTNWVVPMGPNVTGFEKDLEKFVTAPSNLPLKGEANSPDGKSYPSGEDLGGAPKVVCLSAGTAAVHLALIACGVGPGDEVLVQSFTFCASSHPITYLGAKPVFIDSERDTWNMDPELLEKAIIERKQVTGKYPKAIVPVALYGMPYDCEKLMAISEKYGIPVIEDAAEGMGSRFNGQVLGTFGRFGVLSFNGNKMITTSGGGALICNGYKAPSNLPLKGEESLLQPPPEGRGFHAGEKTIGVHSADPLLYGVLKEFAKEHRENPTDAEMALWQMLRRKGLDYKFRRQHIIGDCIADFFCCENNLCIEIDGGYHNVPSQIKRDEERTLYLERMGCKELRFTNEEVIANTDAVLEVIKNTCDELSTCNPDGKSSLLGEDLGGAVSPEEDANEIMWYATQARDAYPYYEHTAIGYNYRMSNVCAGIGRGQMTVLDAHIAHHKHVQELYKELLKDVKGVTLHEQPADPRYDSNFWLCAATLDPNVKVKGQENAYKEVIKSAVGGAAGVIKAVESATTDCQPNDNVEALRVFMLAKKVECRPVWKPMHKQPVYTGAPSNLPLKGEAMTVETLADGIIRQTSAKSVAYINGVSEEIFKVGFCLPAGPYVTDDDVRYIVDCIKEAIAE